MKSPTDQKRVSEPTPTETTGGNESSTTADDTCEEIAAALQTAVNAAYEDADQFRGDCTVTVSTPACGVMHAVAGESGQGQALARHHLLRIGSVTKTYVAATVLKSASDGLVDPEHALSRFFEGVPNGDKMIADDVRFPRGTLEAPADDQHNRVSLRYAATATATKDDEGQRLTHEGTINGNQTRTMAELRWRKFNGYASLPLVLAGEKFSDGERQTTPQNHAEDAA